MKKYLSRHISSLLVLTTAIFLAGCAMGNKSIAQEDSASVASKIIPSKTTQSEVHQTYGEPMRKQANSDGTEVWVYSMMDTKFRTYVPFATLIVGNDGAEGKELSIKFNRSKVVISQDFTRIINGAPTAETNSSSTNNRNEPNQQFNPTPIKPREAQKNTNPEIPTNLADIYENRSESNFIFSLQLEKNGSATYEEPILAGNKSIKLRGQWKKNGNDLLINFGKSGIYRYVVQPQLSWADFGCKGGSFGLQNRSTPKSKSRSVVHDVWRKSDLKKTDACQPI